jgi:hypothetical protein
MLTFLVGIGRAAAQKKHPLWDTSCWDRYLAAKIDLGLLGSIFGCWDRSWGFEIDLGLLGSILGS